jgi:serine/threonine protein kinase
MFVKELQALGRIMRDEDHAPNLLMLYGAFLEQDVVTMVLEYMDRGSLEQLIHYLNQRKHPNDPLPPSSTQLPLHSSLLLMQEEDVVAAMAYQMVSGLAFLHARHMLHRDLKPANVLLHSSGHVKLADFGISTLASSSNATPSVTTMMIMSTCLANTVVGTAYYMSPERLRAKPYGRSSDVWSLGCVLMELCVGHTPWQPPTPQHGDVVGAKRTFTNIHSLVELVMTMEETPVEELVPRILRRRNSNDDNQSNDSSVNEGNSSTERLREILLGCLQLQPGTSLRDDMISFTPLFTYMSELIVSLTMTEKRMPAKILLQSPWFGLHHEIHLLQDATDKVRDFLQSILSSPNTTLSSSLENGIWWSVPQQVLTDYTTSASTTTTARSSMNSLSDGPPPPPPRCNIEPDGL